MIAYTNSRALINVLETTMMRSGTVFPLQPLALLTAGTESGSSLIPTPTASTGGANHNSPTTVAGKRFAMNLAGYAQMWPTPQARDYRSGDNPDSKRAERKRSQGWSRNLNDAVLLPTPCARDWKDNGRSPAELARHTKTLATHAGGQLNPTWVEWLMGFEAGWTDLSNSETP